MQNKDEYVSAALDAGLDMAPLYDSSQDGCDYLMPSLMSQPMECCLQELPENYEYGLPLITDDEPLCHLEDLSSGPLFGGAESDLAHVRSLTHN